MLWQHPSGPSEAQSPVLSVPFVPGGQGLGVNASLHSQHPKKDQAQGRCSKSQADEFLSWFWRSPWGKQWGDDNGDTQVTRSQCLIMRNLQCDGLQVSPQSNGATTESSPGCCVIQRKILSSIWGNLAWLGADKQSSQPEVQPARGSKTSLGSIRIPGSPQLALSLVRGSCG